MSFFKNIENNASMVHEIPIHHIKTIGVVFHVDEML